MPVFNNIVKRGEVFAVKIATETFKGDFALLWRRAKPKMQPRFQVKKKVMQLCYTITRTFFSFNIFSGVKIKSWLTFYLEGCK